MEDSCYISRGSGGGTGGAGANNNRFRTNFRSSNTFLQQNGVVQYSASKPETDSESDTKTRLAGVHPSHLYNGGRPLSQQISNSNQYQHHQTSSAAALAMRKPKNNDQYSNTNQYAQQFSSSISSQQSQQPQQSQQSQQSQQTQGVVYRKPKTESSCSYSSQSNQYSNSSTSNSGAVLRKPKSNGADGSQTSSQYTNANASSSSSGVVLRKPKAEINSNNSSSSSANQYPSSTTSGVVLRQKKPADNISNASSTPTSSTQSTNQYPNSSTSQTGNVVMRRPKADNAVLSNSGNTSSSSSTRRQGMYLPSMRASLAVMNASALESSIAAHSKPPLPPESSSQPRPPPRTRPKSWTSSLFNAMRTNHKSVNFQSVMEEQNNDILDGSKYNQSSKSPSPIVSLDEETQFPQQPQLRLPKPHSRTPSPFRTIMKGIVKGSTNFTFGVIS